MNWLLLAFEGVLGHYWLKWSFIEKTKRMRTMAKKALYGKVLESQTFDTQAEANEWAQKKKATYKAADITLKADVNRVDATRRRWKATLYQKV
jgi:hypothetical protein